MTDILPAPEVERLEIHDTRPSNMDKNGLYFHDLTQEEAAEIKDARERYIFAVIYGIPEKDKQELYRCFGPRVECLPPYLKKQKDWQLVAAYYIGKRKHLADPQHSPEFVDFVIEKLGPDYRLYILASNPGVLEVKDSFDDSTIETIRRFCRSLRHAKSRLESFLL